MAKESARLTDRDRFWLRHHGACEKSGLTGKAYARRHRLSIYAFYQSRTRLREAGVLEAATDAKPRPESRFARVELPIGAGPRYRVRLPNGALVEWEGASGPDLAVVLDAASQIG